MVQVHLRDVTVGNFQECINLRVEQKQEGLVASNMKSLAEAKANPNLFPFALYDATTIGYEKPLSPMIGFTMYEITAGVGFIQRLMIDQRYQHQGYGKAAMIEVIRRLKLYPQVQLIATSHRQENIAASQLYRSLSFVDWEIAWAKENPSEVFLRLDEEVLNVQLKLAANE